jgi:hypothetical protein
MSLTGGRLHVILRLVYALLLQETRNFNQGYGLGTRIISHRNLVGC